MHGLLSERKFTQVDSYFKVVLTSFFKRTVGHFRVVRQMSWHINPGNIQSYIPTIQQMATIYRVFPHSD